MTASRSSPLGGRCLSLVYEVFRPAVPICASAAEMEAAGSFSVQPSLSSLFHKYLNDWKPEEMFLGNQSAIGSGVGSVRRMAVAALAGPRGSKADGTRRECGMLRDARQLSHEMLENEIADAGSAYAVAMGAPPPLQHARHTCASALYSSPLTPHP